MEKIKFAKVSDTGIIPTKRTEDAGYDLYVDWEQVDINSRYIPAHTTMLLPTGVACAIPDGYYFQIEERGSTGSRGLKKSAGIIDSGFRNEIFVALTNTNTHDIKFVGSDSDSDIDNTQAYAKEDGTFVVPFSKDKAVAQLILHELPDLEAEEISYEELKNIPSERGVGCLGSTGK